MMEHLEMTKSSSTALMFHHKQVMDQVQTLRQNLHMIIEQLAEREQTHDLQGFLKRESVFTSGGGEASASNTLQSKGPIKDDGSQSIDKQNLEQEENDQNLVFQDSAGEKQRHHTNSEDTQSMDSQQIHEAKSQSVRSQSDANEETEQDFDSDVEDLFLDALDEIQNATTRFNKTK